jgi:hypothetical protein
MPFLESSSMLLAYVANNNSNDLLTALTKDGINWTGSRLVQGQSSTMTPALVHFFVPTLSIDGPVLAYVANNDSNDLLTAYTDDGVNWTGSRLAQGQSSKQAPALVGFPAWPNPVFPGPQLILAYVANNDSNDLLTASSTDGINWMGSRLVQGQSSKTAPALVEFHGQLILAYVANNDSNDLLTASSTDGVHWTGSRPVQGQSSKMAPALVEFQGELILAYVANNDSNDLLTASSTDGIHWTGSRPVQGQSSKMAPALAASADARSSVDSDNVIRLNLAYVANNDSNDLLTASSTDGINWTGSRLVQGQSSKTAPALMYTLGDLH